MTRRASLDDYAYFRLPRDLEEMPPAVVAAHEAWMVTLEALPDYSPMFLDEFSRAVRRTKDAFHAYLHERDAFLVRYYLERGHTCTPQEEAATKHPVFTEQDGRLLFSQHGLIHRASILQPGDVDGYPYFFLLHALDLTEFADKPFICAYETLGEAQAALALRFVIVERPKP